VRRSDYYGLGVAVIGSAISVFFGSYTGAGIALVIGIALIAVGHFKRDSDDAPDSQTIFEGAIPSQPAPTPITQSDPKIVPSYARGRNSTSPTDDEFILTNHGGGDAFDVQVEAVETGLVTIRFAPVSMIAAKQVGAVSPKLAAFLDGRERKLPFNDLAAYLEEAAQRGLNHWNGRITYRDSNNNRFETTFILKHSHRYDVETESFSFSRLQGVG
jgi:hypothetical protein